MESRRSRTIVQAYLRGLTRPDYPNGIKSIVREELILNAVDSDITADKMLQLSHVKSAMISHMKVDARQKAFRDVFKYIDNAYSFMVMNYNDLVEDDNEIDDLAKLYKLLAKLGIINDE